MILACAVRDEAAARQQRFADHAHFHQWRYHTLEGQGSASLCEIWLTYNEEADPAARLVAHDAEQHIVRSINEVHTRLTETEAARARRDKGVRSACAGTIPAWRHDARPSFRSE